MGSQKQLCQTHKSQCDLHLPSPTLRGDEMLGCPPAAPWPLQDLGQGRLEFKGATLSCPEPLSPARPDRWSPRLAQPGGGDQWPVAPDSRVSLLQTTLRSIY